MVHDPTDAVLPREAAPEEVTWASEEQSSSVRSLCRVYTKRVQQQEAEAGLFLSYKKNLKQPEFLVFLTDRWYSYRSPLIEATQASSRRNHDEATARFSVSFAAIFDVLYMAADYDRWPRRNK